MKYEQVQDDNWFPPENAAALKRLIETYDIKTVLEVGSYLGKSAVFFGELVQQVYCVDPFVLWPDGKMVGVTREDFCEEFYNNLAKTNTNNVTVFRATSRDTAKRFDKQVDLIYLDAQHDYKSVVEDIIMWRDKGAKIICGDDFDEHWPTVKAAVSDFVEDFQVDGRIWYKVL